MLAFILAPFLIALQIFVFIRVLKHLKAYHIKGIEVIPYIFGLLFFGGIVAVLFGFFLDPTSELKRYCTKIGFYWFGILLYFFLGYFFALVLRFFVLIIKKRKVKRESISKSHIVFLFGFTAIMSVLGIYNAHDIHITNYEVAVEKESVLDELNVVLLADLHIGYNMGLKEIEDMVNKVNDLHPDVIVIAGDIFDNEFEAVENPIEMTKLLSSMESKYGTYATYGNHDIEEKILMGFTFHNSKEEKAKVEADPRMNQMLMDAGITLLYDSYVSIEDIVLYGRPDSHKINFGNTKRIAASDITNDIDTTKPVIVVAHEPDELDEYEGVDVVLSGHTHAGQLWPGTLTIHLMWENAYGLYQTNNLTSIVTSGIGLFGPNMRLGSIAEICNIKLKFE